MSSNTISIDLRNKDSWTPSNESNEELSPMYQQRRREPKVGWMRNVFSTVEGIKSINLFEPISILNEFPRLNDTVALLPTSYIENIASNSVGGAGFSGRSMYYSHDFFTFVPSGPIYRMIAIMGIENVASPFALEICVRSSTTTMVTTRVSTLLQNLTLVMFDANYSFNANLGGAIPTTPEGVFSLEGSSSGGVYSYTITHYALTGITVDTTIHKGITSFGNYLIFYTNDTMFWSDPNDFTEFTVGGASLAGSQKISEAKGEIVSIVPYPQGMMIYCTLNVISAQYSGDATNPWIYTEVRGGKGVIANSSKLSMTRDERAAQQFAVSSEGIQAVTYDSATLLASKLNALVTSGIFETKAVGTREIIKHLRADDWNLSTETDRVDRITFIDSINEFLFVGLAKGNAWGSIDNLEDRLYILNLTTGTISSMEGSVVSITPVLSSKGNTLEACIVFFNAQVDSNGTVVHPNHKAVLPLYVEVDIYNTYIPPQGTTRKDSEIFIGELSLNADRNTEVLSVKLYGDYVLKDIAGVVDETTRAKVYAYSSIHGDDNPVEFTYYPTVDKYLGFITGDDIELEVRGKYFNLTDIEIELQDGGRVGA